MAPKHSRDSGSESSSLGGSSGSSSTLGGYPNVILPLGVEVIPEGIPLSPFTRCHDQAPKFAVPNEPSVYTEVTLGEVVNRFHLGQNFLYRVPKSSDSPSSCRVGEITVFKDDLDGGLRFPLHPFLQSVLIKHNLAPGQIVPNGWRMLAYFLLLCLKNDISPSVKLCRLVFEMKRSVGLKCFVYLSCKENFNVPICPSSNTGWKRRFFFIRPRVGEFSFPNIWGYPDVSKFNRPVPRTAPLKQQLDRLLGLAPLGGKMFEVLSDEMLMSVGLGHVEGMNFDASAVFKMARQKSRAPDASSLSGRKRAAVSSPTRDVPTPQNPLTSGRSSSPRSPVDRIVGCVDIELKKGLERKVATFGETLYERAKDAERRALKAKEEINEKDLQVGRLVAERERTLVEMKKKDAELHNVKNALSQLEQKMATHEFSQSDAVSIYKKTNEYKETLAMYGSKSYVLALDHVKAWLRQSHPAIDPTELEEFLSALDVGSMSPRGDDV
ncbi:Uncharacterized protein Adt_43706 [Abeliophyllum distichum]|uniref:Transposase (putative) gypsy type domain-containing protein n=1 Tax=Abeliophyllum distichum TaxID=126358 RepID=A0ABD1PCC8_9LAMI